MDIHKYAGIKKKQIEVRRHIRLSTKVSVKIDSPRMDLIESAAKLKGVSLSAFCKTAALKEARREVLFYRKDRVEIAKRILADERRRMKNEARVQIL